MQLQKFVSRFAQSSKLKTHFVFKKEYFDQTDGLSVSWISTRSSQLVNGKYFHGSLQKNIAVGRKPPQSFVLQTMMCLKNSIRVCHF